MRLYHFTSNVHWPEIEQDGALRPSESNVGSPVPNLQPYGERYAGDVVWLLDTSTLEFDHGLGKSFVDKTTTRLTVEVPERYATRWLQWAPARAMNPTWFDAFVKRAGGLEAVEHWWVFPSELHRRHWLEVRDMPSDTVIWSRNNTTTIGTTHE